MSTRTFRFRAECVIDVITWLMLCDELDPPFTYRITKADTMRADVDVEYTTDVAQGLVHAMRSVADGQMMIETHALAEKYTGERDSRLSERYPAEEPVVLPDLIRQQLEEDFVDSSDAEGGPVLS